MTTWHQEMALIAQVLIAFVLGAVIGFERELRGVQAGVRTFAALTVGSCVFGLVSSHVFGADPSRIAAQVVIGVGFLGAGLIFRQGDYVSGLTTAASLWSTAAVGLAVAYHMYVIAVLSTILMLLLLLLPRFPGWSKLTKHQSRQKSSNSATSKRKA